MSAKGKQREKKKRKDKVLKQRDKRKYKRDLRSRIRLFDDPILKTICKDVTESDDYNSIVKDLIRILAATGDGVGLAAPQIGYDKRVVVYRSDASGKDIKAMINPQIVGKSDNTRTVNEGCLSYPGCFTSTERHTKIEVTWQDTELNEHQSWFEGRQSIILQHEIDHLYGVCLVGEYYDQLSDNDKDRLKNNVQNNSPISV